jgi:hypothetical protein
MFDAKNPKNDQVLQYLASEQSCSPRDVEDPYMTLGTHPDLVERLWDQLGRSLPKRCDWVVGNRPVLLRHDSGVVFGIAIGTSFYALRLPPEDRQRLEASKRNSVETQADQLGLVGGGRDQYINAQMQPCPVGSEWTCGRWLAAEMEWCRRAYEWAQ